MKKHYIKTVLALLLSVTCLLCAAACTDAGKTQEPAGSQEPATSQEPPLASGSLGSLASGNNLTYYLKIDGIEGACRDSKHDRWIDVVSFSHGAVQAAQTDPGDSSAEESAFEPIVFTHKVDKATPKLQQSCMSGHRIRSAEFQATASIAGQQTTVYKVAMDGVSILSARVYTMTDETGNSYLVEEVQLLADKLTWTATTIGLDNAGGGSTEASFDQTKKC